MDPEELQGVLRTIGQQSNGIQFLKDQIALRDEEIKMLREKLKEYEPENAGQSEETVHSGEMVHSDNGKNDFSLSNTSNGGSE